MIQRYLSCKQLLTLNDAVVYFLMAYGSSIPSDTTGVRSSRVNMVPYICTSCLIPILFVKSLPIKCLSDYSVYIYIYTTTSNIILVIYFLVWPLMSDLGDSRSCMIEIDSIEILLDIDS